MGNKVLAICVLVSVLSGVALAQNITYDIDNTVPVVTETIVRSWGTDKGVSYYWVGDQPYLDVETYGGGLLYRAKMPTDINLKDMFVDQTNDILYFCGTTASPSYHIQTGAGVVGLLDLNSITSSSSVNIEWVKLSTLSVVTKLVEYDNGGLAQIVAIGVEHWSVAPYTYTQYYFVECDDAITSLSNTNYSPFSLNERYEDIMLTDNYVVFFGYDSDPSVDAMCYRKTERTNVYSPLRDDIHYFKCSDEVFSRTHTTALDGDNIMTSYLYIEPLYGYCFTHLRTIDVDIDVMTFSQEYFQIEKSEPTGIVFIPDDASVVIMHEFKFGGTNNSNFIHIDPYPYVSYLTTVDYLPGENFSSISTHMTKYYLAGKGATWFYRDKSFNSYSSPSCPTRGETRLWMLDIIVHLYITYPLGTPQFSASQPYLTAPVTTSNSSSICQQ